jgi:hypothetical protein
MADGVFQFPKYVASLFPLGFAAVVFDEVLLAETDVSR